MMKPAGILLGKGWKNRSQVLVIGIVIYLCCPGACFAQAGDRQQVSGRVISSGNGEALPGVNVMMKGSTTGTVTDVSGNYRIEVSGNNPVLVFSFIGFQQQEIPVNRQTMIDVRLETDVQSLEQVVVIGYGSQKSTRVTGAIASLKSTDLEERPVGRLDQALMGKLAGVQVQQTSGSPGKSLAVKVRGTSSINFSNTPLYVVDGFPISGDLNNLNTQDIESIEVLKDAASAAIYGSRGANGVVLITTKAGKEGKPVIQLDISRGVQTRFSRYDVLNRDEWIEYAIEERNNTWMLQGGKASDPNSARTNSNYWIDPAWLTDPGSLPDNDWQDIVDRTASVSNYQLSASASTDKFKYYISGNYFNQNGIIIGSDFKRIHFTYKYIFNCIIKQAVIVFNCNKGLYLLLLTYNFNAMTQTVGLIARNIKQLRELKNLSQKEVCADSGIPQGQYSRIENGKVELSISTLEKLAAVFEVDIAGFFKSEDLDQEVNLPLMQKIKLIDTLADDEQQALLKMIDLALANKRMKDNLQLLIAQ